MAEDFVFLVGVAWLLAFFRILFSKSLSWFWKLSYVLLFLFYAALYQTLLLKKWELLLDNPMREAGRLLFFFFDLLPLLLFVIWPLELWRLLRTPAPLAERSFRTLFVITVFYWLFWFTAAWLGYEPRRLLQSALSKVENVKLPEPPVESKAP